MKIPRKAKKRIPAGLYCYRPIKAPCKENNYVYKVKNCPFHKHIEDIEGKCKWLNNTVEDQVKDCGIKVDFYNEGRKIKKQRY